MPRAIFYSSCSSYMPNVQEGSLFLHRFSGHLLWKPVVRSFHSISNGFTSGLWLGHCKSSCSRLIHLLNFLMFQVSVLLHHQLLLSFSLTSSCKILHRFIFPLVMTTCSDQDVGLLNLLLHTDRAVCYTTFFQWCCEESSCSLANFKCAMMFLFWEQQLALQYPRQSSMTDKLISSSTGFGVIIRF